MRGLGRGVGNPAAGWTRGADPRQIEPREAHGRRWGLETRKSLFPAPGVSCPGLGLPLSAAPPLWGSPSRPLRKFAPAWGIATFAPCCSIIKARKKVGKNWSIFFCPILSQHILHPTTPPPPRGVLAESAVWPPLLYSFSSQQPTAGQGGMLCLLGNPDFNDFGAVTPDMNGYHPTH